MKIRCLVEKRKDSEGQLNIWIKISEVIREMVTATCGIMYFCTLLGHLKQFVDATYSKCIDFLRDMVAMLLQSKLHTGNETVIHKLKILEN